VINATEKDITRIPVCLVSLDYIDRKIKISLQRFWQVFSEKKILRKKQRRSPSFFVSLNKEMK
jgi:hypothetical protein